MTEAATSTSPRPQATRPTAPAQPHERHAAAETGAEENSVFGDLLASLGADANDGLASLAPDGAGSQTDPAESLGSLTAPLDPAWLVQGMHIAQTGGRTANEMTAATGETKAGAAMPAAGGAVKAGPVELTPQESDAVLNAVCGRTVLGGQVRDVGGEVLGATLPPGVNTAANRAHAAMGQAGGSTSDTLAQRTSAVAAQRPGVSHSTGQVWAAAAGMRHTTTPAAVQQAAALAVGAAAQAVPVLSGADAPFASAVQAMQVVQQFLDPQAAGFERRALRSQDGGWVDGSMPAAAGVASSSGLAPEARVEASGAAEHAGLTADSQSADETVAYWASGNAQNAEVTVDRDGQAVQVSVWMNGKDAHVTFRSEEAATRAWLQDRTEDLQQALEREGIALSGMTVSGDGAQAAQQGGAQGGRSGQESLGPAVSAARPAPKQGGEANAAVASPPRPGNSAGGHRLDVFA